MKTQMQLETTLKIAHYLKLSASDSLRSLPTFNWNVPPEYVTGAWVNALQEGNSLISYDEDNILIVQAPQEPETEPVIWEISPEGGISLRCLGATWRLETYSWAEAGTPSADATWHLERVAEKFAPSAVTPAAAARGWSCRPAKTPGYLIWSNDPATSDFKIFLDGHLLTQIEAPGPTMWPAGYADFVEEWIRLRHIGQAEAAEEIRLALRDVERALTAEAARLGLKMTETIEYLYSMDYGMKLPHYVYKIGPHEATVTRDCIGWEIGINPYFRLRRVNALKKLLQQVEAL